MGNGHFGEVRKCKHARSNIVRAVKILKKEKLDEYEHERIKNDIEMLKVLDHPGILKIHEFYQDDKRLYLVIENELIIAPHAADGTWVLYRAV